MVDKMMRIAGRGADGLAKAVNLTNDGELLIDKDIKRHIELTSNIDDLYYKGTEYTVFVEGAKRGNQSVTKSDDYVELSVYNNPSANAYSSACFKFPTEHRVRAIYAEVSLHKTNSYNSRISISVIPRINMSDTEFDKEERFSWGQTNGVKQVIKIDTEGMELHNHFARIGLTDVSTSVSTDAVLKIHRVYAEVKPKTEADVTRLLSLQSGLIEDLFYKGNELSPVIDGYALGSGTITKSEEYLELTLTGNPSAVGMRSVYIDNLIDMSKVKAVHMEYEIIKEAGNNLNVILATTSVGNTSYPTFSFKKEVFHNSNSRGTVSLNINGREVNNYIKVHLLDNSSTVSVDGTLRIYRIWIEYSKPIKEIAISEGGSGNLNVLDYETGEEIALTAVTDPDGKSALRIVDSAPYGYDAVSESIRTSGSKLKAIANLTKNGTVATNAELTTSPFFIGNLREFFITVDAGAVSSPIEIKAHYYLSDMSTKVKTVTIEDDSGDADRRGTCIKYIADSAFISFSVKNKSASTRTIKLEVYGG